MNVQSEQSLNISVSHVLVTTSFPDFHLWYFRVSVILKCKY